MRQFYLAKYFGKVMDMLLKISNYYVITSFAMVDITMAKVVELQ